MSEAPKYIWLQWIPNDIPNNDEITWCSDPIHEDDTAYVRKNVAEATSSRRLELLKRCELFIAVCGVDVEYTIRQLDPTLLDNLEEELANEQA